MSEDQTDRLALPMLRAGKAQKEVSHNEALTLLDMLVQASVEAVGVDDPPASPQPGQCWIVGAAPNGAWAAHAGALACWTPGGWRFAAGRAGMRCWSLADGFAVRFDGDGWIAGDLAAARVVIGGNQVVGQQRPAIAEPAPGSNEDAEARAVIGDILVALRTHGLIAEG
ncbi:DUF2793 domain-containing protein [Stakelama marina]|uniref:DUF2793 domain-containing protein n=1 Tax=Stakelama marina TaxID=2826939 RepID=A0A8T4IHC0_9SPHN|nr:DUF2793 domain-containing protein [Stakelama marina]MBR0553901.1 DUF2793 domain-containing protein [Stakelama marina]